MRAHGFSAACAADADINGNPINSANGAPSGALGSRMNPGGPSWHGQGGKDGPGSYRLSVPAPIALVRRTLLRPGESIRRAAAMTSSSDTPQFERAGRHALRSVRRALICCVSQGKTFPLAASNTSTISTVACTGRSAKSFRKRLQFRASREMRQVATPSMPKSSAKAVSVSVSVSERNVPGGWFFVLGNQEPKTNNGVAETELEAETLSETEAETETLSRVESRNDAGENRNFAACDLLASAGHSRAGPGVARGSGVLPSKWHSPLHDFEGIGAGSGTGLPVRA